MLRAIKSDGNWLPILLLESLLIAGSILLAFGLSGWWESRQDRHLAERALVSFEHEIRQNRDNLRGVMPYHQQIKDSFTLLGSTRAVNSFEDLRSIEGFQGFRPAFLTTTAWETAVATGALSYIDYDLVAALSNAYTLQERFSRLSDARFLLTPGAFADGNVGSTLISIEIYLSDVTYSAGELVQYYDQMLSVLESR